MSIFSFKILNSAYFLKILGKIVLGLFYQEFLNLNLNFKYFTLKYKIIQFYGILKNFAAIPRQILKVVHFKNLNFL